MDNTDLYKFIFVDRESSFNKLDKDISEYDRIPVIYGNHGSGKSFFLKHYLAKKDISYKIYFELKEEDHLRNCIELIVREIERHTGLSIFHFLKHNYKKLLKVVGDDIINIIDDKYSTNIGELVKILEGSAKLLDKERNEISSSTVLFSYALKALKKTTLIVIDNFHLCDEASKKLLIEIMKKSILDHTLYKFIVSFSNGEKEKWRFEEQVPINRIDISPFDDYMLFYSILYEILDIQERDKELVKNIHIICEGYPQRLIDMVHLLDEKGALTYDKTSFKATINREVANSIIFSDSKLPHLNEMAVNERIIVYIVTEICIQLSVNQLAKISRFVFLKLFRYDEITEQDFIKEIFTLERKGFLSFDAIDGSLIKMGHDLKYIFYKAECDRSIYSPIISQALYEYLSSNENDYISLSLIEYKSIQAYHAYKAQISDWQRFNFETAYEHALQSNHVLAAQILQRIPLSEMHKILNEEQIIFVVRTFYDSSYYSEAYALLMDMDDSCSFEKLYWKAKLEKIILKQKESEETIEQLLKRTDMSDVERIRALSLKERIYANSSRKRNVAFESYLEIKKNYCNNNSVEECYGECLKTSVEFYRGGEAEKDLREAQIIAEKNNNEYELGAIHTNKGFDLFWQGKIQEAIGEFIESIDLLKRINISEISYPLNNLANCYILTGDLNMALEYLKLALFWTNSEYVKLTSKTIMLYCKVIMNTDYEIENDADYKKIKNLAANNNMDISIQIKTKYYLGQIMYMLGNTLQSKALISQAFSTARTHDSKYLPYIWMDEYDDNITQDMFRRLPTDKYITKYKYKFDPWLVTLSHE